LAQGGGLNVTYFKLHITVNGKGGGEEEFEFSNAYELDDMLGIVKTYLEHSAHASSFVFTAVRSE
jgi:hypothetical protein